MTNWVTKLKLLTEKQVSAVPDELTIERGADYVILTGEPVGLAKEFARWGVKDAANKSSLSQMRKLLVEAKDADTKNVFTQDLDAIMYKR